MPESMTTLKVRSSTRDRINAGARERQMTADQYLGYLMEEAAWATRIEQARVDMANLDDDYVDESRAWDAAQSYLSG